MPNLRIIYALCDPADPTIPKYIGRTGSTLRRRLFEHMVEAYRGKSDKPINQWLRNLDARNLLPKIVQQEIVEADKASEREAYWTEFFSPIGLFNIKVGDRQPTGDDISARRKKWLTTPKGQKWLSETRADKQKQPSLLLWAHRQVFKQLRTAGAKKNQRPVICVETGERFETIVAAEKSKGGRGINDAISHGWRFRGFHWKYAEKNTQS